MDVALDLARQKYEGIAGEQLLLMPEEALPDDDEAGQASAPGKPGRPPGRRNKKTEAFVEFVRAIGGDPLLGLAKAASTDPILLAEALGMKPGEVWVKQQELRKALLPYFHAERPKELKVPGGGALAVAVFTGEGPRGDQEVEAKDAVQALLDLERNQWVSDQPADQSNDGQSNAPPSSSVGSKG